MVQLPETVQRKVPQCVHVEAVSSGLQPVDGPVYQTAILRQLQEAYHPLDLAVAGQHGHGCT